MFYFDLVVQLTVSVVQALVVRMVDGGSEDGIRQDHDHHHRREDRRLDDLQKYRRGHTFLLVLIDVH